MRIAMRGIDGDAALAGVGRPLDMARAEGERLAAAAREHDGAGVDPLHLDARDRPGVGPRPRLCLAPGGDGLVKGALQQHLREQRLGVDVGALAEQDQAGEGEKKGKDEAGHLVTSRHCERSEAIHLNRNHERMDRVVASLLAMTSHGRKRARAALGGRWKPRALWKRRWGGLLFSSDVNAVTSDAD